jgi:hypothetical protein
MRLAKGIVGLAVATIFTGGIYQSADAFSTCTTARVPWTSSATCPSGSVKVTSTGIGNGPGSYLCVNTTTVLYASAYGYSSTGLRKILCHPETFDSQDHECDLTNCSGSVEQDGYAEYN